YAAQAVAERGGYKPSLRCVVVEAPLPSGPTHIPYDAPVDALGPDRAPELLRFLESTSALAAWRRLVPLGWRFRRIVPDLVRGLRSLEVLGVRSWAPHPWCPEGLVVVEKSLAS